MSNQASTSEPTVNPLRRFWTRAERRLSRYGDPFVDIVDHRVSVVEKLWRRIRYTSARRGLPLTRNERRIRKLHNSAEGKRIWVIGNGPSLNETDLRPLKNEITIGTNSIFLNKENMGFNVTHYVVEDYLVAEDRAEEIAAMKGPTKWFGNYLQYALPKADDTLWTNVSVDYRQFKGWPKFGRDAGRIAFCGGTVTYLCIQLAYYLGASEVVLVGVDHSYVVPDDEPLEGHTLTSTRDDVNHFHSDYFGKGKRWHLPHVDRMELSYIQANKVFAHDQRRIVNATKGGMLEVFERADYDELVAEISSDS
jgi:hypothetical protein